MLPFFAQKPTVFTFSDRLISTQFKREEGETLALRNFSELYILLPGFNCGKITQRERERDPGVPITATPRESISVLQAAGEYTPKGMTITL